MVSVHRENEVDGARDATPLLALLRQPLPSGRGELVVAGPAVVVGRAPRRRDVFLSLETVERRVERSLSNAQDLFRALLESLGDAPAVHRSELQRLEDEHVEGSLEQLVAWVVGRHCLPFDGQKEATTASFRPSRGRL